MVEKELKVILSKEQYEVINQLFAWDKIIDQTNYYYVDIDDINADLTIRVRNIGGNLKLQVKIPIKKKRAVHIKEEYECSLTKLPNTISSDFLYEKFGLKLRGNIFTRIGELKTMRKMFVWENTAELCLDQNWYLGDKDYELEIEYQDKGIPNELMQVFQRHMILFDKEVEGKNSRFLRKYVQIALESNRQQ